MQSQVSTSNQKAETELEAALSSLDQRLLAANLVVWVGTEPTFTDRFSDDREWVAEALGSAKLEQARRFTAALATRCPGAALLRTVGRQYPEEPQPRWNFGLLRSRDSRKYWNLPADPLLGGRSSGDGAPLRLLTELQRVLGDQALHVALLDDPAPPRAAAPKEVRTESTLSSLPLRLLYSRGKLPALSDAQALACEREPLGSAPTPAHGLTDELSEAGLRLVCIGELSSAVQADDRVVRVELPRIDSVEEFSDLLSALSDACHAANISGLILSGFPPPVDQSVAWTSVTPDPGVLEINTAPCLGTLELLQESRVLYAVAASIGLSPERMHYNGDLVDSGGGGQITLGGPSFERSPFFLHPHVLPRLVAFLSRHPALSYLFAVDSVGGSSQAPRADEGPSECLGELALTLELLSRAESSTPGQIWSGLAPFLVDRFGSSHRAELNIEKLANPHVADRGYLGLVEFRAFRMADTPERVACLAALLRAIIGHLASGTGGAKLADWGRELHDRFALPFNLQLDLESVFSELAASGWGLADAITSELRRDHRMLARIDLADGATLQLRHAVEFWPLVGDLSAQSGTSRLVDSSTRRYELLLRCPAASIGDWELAVDGYAIPWHVTEDSSGPALVKAIRCRSFVPSPGLHPDLPAHGPLNLNISKGGGPAYAITLHWWRPDGGAYAGLPRDREDALQRTQARCTVQQLAGNLSRAPTTPPAGSLTEWTFDTRWA